MCRDVATEMNTSWVAASGILSSEIDDHRHSLGLTVEIVGGRTCELAHTSMDSKTRFETWGVDLETFERLAIPAIQGGRGVTIVDELGPVQLMSTRFREGVASLFLRPGLVLATAPQNFDPFVDHLKHMDGVTTLPVNFHTRDELAKNLVSLLQGAMAARQVTSNWMRSILSTIGFIDVSMTATWAGCSA